MRLIDWLSKDPEHWPIYRLVVLDPWRTPSKRRWKKQTPDWVRALTTNAVIAHAQHDPFGRQHSIEVGFADDE